LKTHTHTWKDNFAQEGKHEPFKVSFSINSEPVSSPSIALKSRAPAAIVQHTNKEKEGETGKQKGETPAG